MMGKKVRFVMLMAVGGSAMGLYAQSAASDSIEMSSALQDIAEAAPEAEDSIAMSATLQEVVVAAPDATKSGNRTFFYPTKQLKESLSTTSQLLAGLQIPDLIINPANGDVSLLGGGELAIRINGRPASQVDLMSISAKDITRVEYVANPGVKYGDAAGVIDITVKRRTEGYGVMLNLLQSPNRGWGDYTAALKYVVGRSEWSVDYHSNPMWNMDCYRNNSEIIQQPAGEVFRYEEGMETPNRMVTHRGALQYSYAVQSSLLFNVQARLLRSNDRYASTGRITTTQNGVTVSGIETEIAPFTSWQGDLDLYFHWKINQRNKLYINVVPTLVKSTSERIYQTEDMELKSRIENKGSRYLIEGVWEGRVSQSQLTGGVRVASQNNEARYFVDNSVVSDKSVEGHCFMEWNYQAGRFRYILGVDGSYFWLNNPVGKHFGNVAPRVFVRYSSGLWGVNLSLNGSVVNPQASQLNPVVQQVDRYQYSTGSLDVVPYRVYKSGLELDFKIRKAQLKMAIVDTYSHRPIMGGKMMVEDKIIQSYYNAGYHNDFILKGEVRMPLFIKELTLSLEGGWHRSISRGVDYRHCYSQGFVNAQLMYMVGKWWFMAKYNNAYNQLWGEMVTGANNNLLNLGVGYRYKSATFMAGVVNPIGNVSIKSRDLSALAQYERTYYASSSNTLVWVGVSINLYKGNRRSATQKRLNNSETLENIKNIQK